MAGFKDKSFPIIEISSCLICNEIFESDRELVDHLLEHCEEERFKTLLKQLEAKNVAEEAMEHVSASQVSHRDNQGIPEFITNSFCNDTSKEENVAFHVDPHIYETATDHADEPKDNQKSNTRRCKVSSTTECSSSNIVPQCSDTSVAHSNVCHICYKSFSLRCNLRTHLYVHVSDKAYKCRICSKTFSFEIDLQNHMLQHQIRC